MADWETGVFVIFRHFSRKCFNNRKLCLISIVYALQSLKFFIKSSWLDLSQDVDSLETENKCHEKDCGEDTFVKFSGWISYFPRNNQFHWPIWATIFLFIYSPPMLSCTQRVSKDLSIHTLRITHFLFNPSNLEDLDLSVNMFLNTEAATRGVL